MEVTQIFSIKHPHNNFLISYVQNWGMVPYTFTTTSYNLVAVIANCMHHCIPLPSFSHVSYVTFVSQNTV